MRFSGMPQRPNPPTVTVQPSGTSATASAAEAQTLPAAGGPPAGAAAAAAAANPRRHALESMMAPDASFRLLFLRVCASVDV